MPYLGYAFILVICLNLVLITLKKEFIRWHPYFLYLWSAGMVLMTTLAGPYLVGFDIHLEYYYAQLHSGSSVMEPIVGVPQGTSIANNIIAPLLPIPTMWVYKLVYPLLFASIPVILYYIFREWIEPVQALLASALFITFPAFFMELPTIARQMTAEIVLVILLYLLIKSELRWRYKLPLVGICGALLPLFHYSIGIVALILLGIPFIVALVRKHQVWKPIGVALLAVTISSSIYLPLAEEGAVAKVIVHRWNAMVPGTLEIDYPLPPELRPPETRPRVYSETGEIQPGSSPQSVGADIPILNKYNVLMRVGLGVGFPNAPITGKIFLIIQWIVLIILSVGMWKSRRNKNYWMFASGGFALLLFMLIPGFSGVLNASRFLHLALFLLAPAFAVALRPKYLLIVLIPYFLFTSGFIFEVTKQESVEQLTIPYNIGLSDYRLDLGASTTEDDYNCARYIVDNELFPIFSDIHGANLMGEIVGYHSDINRALQKVGLWPTGYVFIRSRNIEEGYLTTWNGPGCRRFVKPEEYGVDFNENIIYQSGDARILEVK